MRARRGERHAYKPIASSLCHTSDPVAVAQALCKLYPFATLYIADLDAIQRRGSHLPTVAALRTALPDVEIWIDAGIAGIEDCRAWLELGVQCVVGSESQRDAASAYRLIDHLGPDQAVLSLDSIHGQNRGPAELFMKPSCWPQRVIAMTLARVGSNEGPDLESLCSLLTHGRKVYAAGGIRNLSDLERLNEMGVAGALLASALHDGNVNSRQLALLE